MAVPLVLQFFIGFTNQINFTVYTFFSFFFGFLNIY